MSLRNLICCLLLGVAPLGAQNLAPVNLVLSPANTKVYGERIVYAELLSTISNSAALYHQVERAEYDAIIKERLQAAKIKDDPYVATVLKGAAVAVELNIINYNEIWDSIPVNTAIYGRSNNYRLKIKCDYELRVVDIATSEVVDSKVFAVEGFPTAVSKSSNELQQHFLRLSALGYLRRAVRETSKRYLLQAVAPAVPIYKIYEENGSRQLLIAGGEGVAYPAGTAFRLIRESQVMVNGKAVLRQETVGEAVVRSNRSGYSQCAITRLEGAMDPSTLAQYVLPSPQNDIPLVWSAKPAPPK